MSRNRSSKTRSRYNRIARFYDWMEGFAEAARFGEWRRLLWSRVDGKRVLEVGVGTGKNMSHYPSGTRILAVDLSERMLAKASKRAVDFPNEVDLIQADAQSLPFPGDAFDNAVATFVFCSVPDPVQGLKEIARVVKPGGDVWLLEHVRVDRPVAIGVLMDLLNPIVIRVMGANINRQTVQTVARAGLHRQNVEDVGGRLVKLIHARSASGDPRSVSQPRPSVEPPSVKANRRRHRLKKES